MRPQLFAILFLLATTLTASSQTLVTSPGCEYCTQAKSWLAERGVQFTEVQGAGQVPRLEYNGKTVVGYNPAAYAQLFTRSPWRSARADVDFTHPMVKAGVKLIVREPDGSIGYGSGAILAVHDGRLLVVTAAHVLRNATTIDFEFHGDGRGAQQFQFAIVGKDDEADAALIEVACPWQFPTLKIARPDANIAKGLSLVYSGCPGGGYPVVRQTSVVDVGRYAGPETIETSGQTTSGVSGGPIGQGDVVYGIASARDPKLDRGIFTTCKSIHRLLDKIRDRWTVQPCEGGVCRVVQVQVQAPAPAPAPVPINVEVKPGPQGPPGRDGEPGPPGRDGESVSREELLELIEAMLAEYQMEAILLDEKGAELKRQTFGPNKPLKLRLVPAKVKN